MARLYIYIFIYLYTSIIFFALWGKRNEKFIHLFFLRTTQIDASGGRMREILKTTTTTTRQKAEAHKKNKKKNQAEPPTAGIGLSEEEEHRRLFNLVTALARSFSSRAGLLSRWQQQKLLMVQ